MLLVEFDESRVFMHRTNKSDGVTCIDGVRLVYLHNVETDDVVGEIQHGFDIRNSSCVKNSKFPFYRNGDTADPSERYVLQFPELITGPNMYIQVEAGTLIMSF